ncbi:MAG TPA: YbhB/YbcL family Raf kinase inhibitor-like protein [Vicinamibacterales bacterium]|nr:YbhB/YbcL family Raf kinase inhibitor-like protein [Vicinamibacterales bacterium]
MRSLLLCVLLVGAQAADSLSDAVLYGRTADVRRLIAAGADVNEMDATGMTPLMVAASQGQTAIARLLIAAKADVNAAGDDGTTALMRAASANRVETLNVLLASGARVDAKTNGGMTALMVASFGGYADAVKALLARKADVAAVDNQRRTSLMAGSASGDPATVEALLAAGADVAAVDAGGGTALTYAASQGHAAAVAALQKHGAKPTALELTMAAQACQPEMVATMLEAGLAANGVEGRTPPIVAAAGENCVDVVRLLLDRGANINAADRDGWTALIKASEAGNFELAQLLVQRGADIEIADSAGRKAWTYAALGGRGDIADLFKAVRAAAPAAGALRVASPALSADQPIPRQYTADGRNDSPPLTWANAPLETQSFAVVCEDPDAGNPPPLVHWVIYNIPATADGLPEAIPFEPDQQMPKTIAGATQGLSGFRRPFYRGPAPPSGKTHHYHFVVYALDLAPALKPGLTRADLLDAIKDHIVGQGELVATYQRQ